MHPKEGFVHKCTPATPATQMIIETMNDDSQYQSFYEKFVLGTGGCSLLLLRHTWAERNQRKFYILELRSIEIDWRQSTWVLEAQA